MSRDGARETMRDGARETMRDGARDSRDGARETMRDGTRDTMRDGAREASRDASRERSRTSLRDEFSARDRTRISTRDDSSTRDSTRESARESSRDAGHGKDKDRGDRIRDWGPLERGRDKVDRERERDKKERDLISSSRQQQRRYASGEVGEGDRAPSPLFGRPPSVGSVSTTLSVARNSSSPAASDGILLSVRETGGVLEGRSSAGASRQVGRDTDREPGELLSGSRVEEVSWRSSVSVVRIARNSKQQPLEPDGGGKRSPPRKRKFSPIVWDYDEKNARPSKLSSVSGASSLSSHNVSKFGGAHLFQALPSQSSAVVQHSSSPLSNENVSPPSKPPSSGRATPPNSVRVHGVCGLSSSPQGSTPSPSVVENRVSPIVAVISSDKDTADTQMKDQVMASPISDEELEPGQLFPEPGSPLRHSLSTLRETEVSTMDPESPMREPESPMRKPDSPMREHGSPVKEQESPVRDPASLMEDNLRLEQQTEEELEEEEYVPPAVTIAASRWAEESHTPQREKSPRSGGGKTRKRRSSSLDSEEGRISSGQDGGLASGPSTSPEPGEYIREKIDTGTYRTRERGNDSDGSVGQGSAGKDRRSNSIEDEEYERELNKRELMELDKESDFDDQEEQRPEVEPDFDCVPPTPPGHQMRAIDMLQGCRTVDEFERLNKIDEGTYGVVYRARNKKTGEIVALKKVKMEKEKEGFPMTSLREINVLLSFHHPSVVDVKEVVVGSTIDSIFMVMEYMEHDLKGLMETMKQPFSQSEVKCLMLQLFEGVKYLHDNWVLHRDLKTSNLLLNNRGELKICDFGLARQYGSPLKAYTHMVVTLWYRAPELLLGSKNYQYSTAIDMWSLGCIMAEFLAKEPLFNGTSELDQIDKIFKTLGTPNDKIWPEFSKLPGVKCNFVRQPYNRLREKFPPTAFAGRPTLSESGFDLLNRLLTYDPQKRITADEALKHDWFREVPLPKSKEFMPTFPARSEHDRRVRRLLKSPDPLEEQRKRELRQGELGGGGLFG